MDFPHSSIMTTTSDYNQTPGSIAKGQRAPVTAGNSYARVLVVEDNEDMRLMLKTLLEMRGGVNVVEAENGEMAIALAENVHLDLILMDGSLPLLDGIETTRRIRERAAACDVPIVFLSGHAQPAYEAKAFAAGCTDYLVKPFDFDEWDRVLERHLSQSKAH
jgi:CheY-like chemotaxis protein